MLGYNSTELTMLITMLKNSPCFPRKSLCLWVTNEHKRQTIGDHDQTALDGWLGRWCHRNSSLDHFDKCV